MASSSKGANSPPDAAAVLTKAVARAAERLDISRASLAKVLGVALLTPAGFAQPAPHAEQQTWFMAVSRHEVTLRRDTASMQFSAAGW